MNKRDNAVGTWRVVGHFMTSLESTLASPVNTQHSGGGGGGVIFIQYFLKVSG